MKNLTTLAVIFVTFVLLAGTANADVMTDVEKHINQNGGYATLKGDFTVPTEQGLATVKLERNERSLFDANGRGCHEGSGLCVVSFSAVYDVSVGQTTYETKDVTDVQYVRGKAKIKQLLANL